MIAIYTYYPFKGKESCGFNNIKELAVFLSLSVEYSKKQFKEVKLVTNVEGKKILADRYKIGFTKICTGLEGEDIDPELWAYAKVKAYALQTEPFISIDLDVILWQRIPNKWLKSKMLFQNKEDFCVERGYQPLVNAMERTTVSDFCKSQNIKYAYNCGVVLANDLSVIKKWYELASEFINSPVNVNFWNYQNNKEQFNYLFEQYFIACVVKNEKVENDIKFLIEDIDYKDVAKPKFKFTHQWGKTKKYSDNVEKIRLRLKKEYPRIYNRINKIDPDENYHFKCLYEKGDDKYKKLLQKTVKGKNIESIVYLGYDGLTSSKFMNTSGKDVDFLYSNDTKHIVPECDLLVIKDMILRWGGKEYSEFYDKKVKAKYIMNAKGVYKTSFKGLNPSP